MQIKFSNGKTFTYTQAFSVDRDFKDGYTRPSVEVIMPLAQTSYNEIESIISDADVMKSFTLVGDEQQIPIYKEVQVENVIVNSDGTPLVDKKGNAVTVISKEIAVDGKGNPIIDHYEQAEAPTSTYDNYTIVGKISVEDGNITFKMYKLSDTEIEKNSAVRAVDELLLSMVESEV